MKILASLAIVYGLGVVMLMPFTGDGASLSPISAASAAPNCDEDGDLHLKDSRKCKGDDYDDSDPCVPDDQAEACGSGGTGGGDLGSAIAMDCTLEVSWGDTDDEGDALPDTIKGDGLGDYSDAVDKVNCNISGPSTPWPIYLGMGTKGRPENSVRKVDVYLGRPEDTKPMSDYLPAYLFQEATEDPNNTNWPDMDKMEPIALNIRPYRDDPLQTADGIHLLPWKNEPYEMGMNFRIPGSSDRFSVSIASEWYPGNESFTGLSCETGGTQPAILAGAPDGPMKDVSVYPWIDGNDDGLADGYTVTTGTITLDPPDIEGNYAEGAPPVTPGFRYAAVCSSAGPDAPCGNPKAPDKCNFLGYVKVQFTMHAKVK